MDLTVVSEHELQGSMPVLDDLRDEGGALRMGALATFIDVAAGTFCHEQVRPDWLATTDMNIHLRRPALGTEVGCSTTTVRAGKKNILSSTVVFDEGGEVARGRVTYTRLRRRDDNPDVGRTSRVGMRLHYVEEPDLESEIERPNLDDYLKLQVVPDELAIELDHHPRIHNSFGSLQGGAAATLAERLGMVAAERRFGAPARVTDLHILYLGQTRAGPFRITGEVLRDDADSVTCEVDIRDAGNDGHLLDLATVRAAVIDA